MGVNVYSKLVVGISLEELFSKIEEIDTFYDEHDKRGNKTGRRIEEYSMLATLPDDRVFEIAKGVKKYDEIKWKYDLYNTLHFDGDYYCGDLKSDLALHYSDYESQSLGERIVGFQIPTTGTSSIKEFDSKSIDDLKSKCSKQLMEMFKYVGEIKTYLIKVYSY